jgi:hypothetical protein
MSNKIEICPSCGKKGLKKMKGRISVGNHSVPGIVYYLCSHCQEKVTDVESEIKIDEYLTKTAGSKKRITKRVA